MKKFLKVILLIVATVAILAGGLLYASYQATNSFLAGKRQEQFSYFCKTRVSSEEAQFNQCMARLAANFEDCMKQDGRRSILCIQDSLDSYPPESGEKPK